MFTSCDIPMFFALRDFLHEFMGPGSFSSDTNDTSYIDEMTSIIKK